MALGTGLRRSDIELLSVSDLDFENSYVTTRSIKTRKSMGSRPVPVPIIAELKKYVSGLYPEQEKIFVDCFKQYRWNKIREKLGLGDFKFHDLRKTFGSVLAQNGVSTAVTQKLLEHSSPDLTNKVYMNVDPVLRQAVDQIPADDWLRASKHELMCRKRLTMHPSGQYCKKIKGRIRYFSSNQNALTCTIIADRKRLRLNTVSSRFKPLITS